jgi:hypothetical protein
MVVLRLPEAEFPEEATMSVRPSDSAPSTVRGLGNSWWSTLLIAILLVVIAALLIQRHGASSPAGSAKAASTSSLTSVSTSSDTKTPEESLAELATLVSQCMRSSRPVLLGSRDPSGPSCVPIVNTGDVGDTVPDTPGDLDGGPGTSLATLYYFGRQGIKSPLEDLAWHQSRLKTFLENEAAVNQPAEESAHEFAEKSRRFWKLVGGWSQLPAGLRPVDFTANDDWPSHCMSALNKAVAAKDLAATQRWAGELAAAAFSLDDLHRWLGFLVVNHLAALEFQQRCATLFEAADALGRSYEPNATISQFPAGVLSLNSKANYYEVERQAERLFSMPEDRNIEVASGNYLTAGSLWVTPGVRETYLKLQAVLSPENRQTWDVAARTPYEHSYLINMLFRAAHADTADDLCAALKKFDAPNPHAKVQELLSVLMYRGHPFAGLEWGDRFQPELLKAAGNIKPDESSLQAMEDACRWTNSFYRTPAEYGVTLTLRDALERKKLDCVRATDMIGAIFRNAGRIGFGNVRWCSETGGHSVAVYVHPEGEQVKMQIFDGLNPSAQPEFWPECYFHGHAWPPGLEDNSAPYAAELYLRGLDSYIWAQGYIIRGPNAGWLTKASVPYSIRFQHGSSAKVFDGPYPQ